MKRLYYINIVCIVGFCLVGLFNCKSRSTDPAADPGARVTGDPAWYFSGNPEVLTTSVYENIFG